MKTQTNIEDGLAKIYSRDTKTACIVAEICDEVLDKSGGLLGRVRVIARNKYNVSISY